MAAAIKPLAVFEDSSGKKVEVFNAIDVKEWEDAGFKKVSDKPVKRSRAKQTPKPQVEVKKTVQTPSEAQPKDDDEL